MIRAKGGKRQPRYFYLKEAGAKKLVKFMSKVQSTESKQKSRVDEICSVLLTIAQKVSLFIEATKSKLEEVRKQREKI